MKSNLRRKYCSLMQRYLERELTIIEFQGQFFETFKEELDFMNEEEFGILDELFGGLDSYTNNVELLRKKPSFYLDETQVREKVSELFQKLMQIK